MGKTEEKMKESSISFESMSFREATREDLPAMIELLHDDPLGKSREIISTPVAKTYLDAFDDISKDKNNTLYILEHNAHLIGILQLTIIPHLNRGGSKRAQIESVHIHRDVRKRGFGTAFMKFAIKKAKDKNCKIVQLTTDKTREQAQKFYSNLGFTGSHIGMKIYI